MSPPLVCPRDHQPLVADGPWLRCADGHRYPIVDGVPVLLLPDLWPTMDIYAASLQLAQSSRGDGYYIETLGLAEHEKQAIRAAFAADGPRPPVDPAVSWLVGATSGWAYADRIGSLTAYPIPELPLPEGTDRALLDVGCNWGRWSFAAARKGWRVVGIDPSLGAILAARRAARDLGLEDKVAFVCGDGRRLPFANSIFDAAFSYSVLQHFAESDAADTLAEIGRVLCPGGMAKVQMAHRLGPRSLYVQARRRFHAPQRFEVRYWALGSMRAVFETTIGPARISAEAFGGLGLLWCDRRVMPRKLLPLITASEGLRRAAVVVPWLRYFADSVYVEAVKAA